MLFRQTVMYALIVGLVAGLVLSLAQRWQVIPIIQHAERYETELHIMQHASGNEAHDSAAWEPQDGVERTGFTVFSNVLTAMGMSLILLSAMLATLRVKSQTRVDWKYGLIWGLAGYAVFFIAPSLGLPPEIPGSVAAPVEARQLWWLAAVVFSAAGLAGVAFIKTPVRWASLSLILAPYLLGPPHTEYTQFADQPPAAAAELTLLSDQFIGATAFANATLWMALGLVSVWAVRRIVSSMNVHD